MLKHISVTLISCCWLFAAAPGFGLEIPVFVDGKQALVLDHKTMGDDFNLTQTRVAGIPSSEKWLYLRIDANKGNYLQFQDWKNKFYGKQILIKQIGEVTQIGLFKPDDKEAQYLLENPTRISILTRIPDPVKKSGQQQTVDDTASLLLKSHGQKYMISHSGLEKSSADRIQEVSTGFGWRLSYVIDSLGIKPEYKKITLGCENNTKPMVVDKQGADYVYIKLNKNNQWRAIKSEKQAKSMQGGERCHRLAQIDISE